MSGIAAFRMRQYMDSRMRSGGRERLRRVEWNGGGVHFSIQGFVRCVWLSDAMLNQEERMGFTNL